MCSFKKLQIIFPYSDLNSDWKEVVVAEDEEIVEVELRVGGGIEGIGLTIGIGFGRLGWGTEVCCLGWCIGKEGLWEAVGAKAPCCNGTPILESGTFW